MIQVETEQSSSLADLAVDLTPMLDILFIVLVFFILTANPVEHALQVELPTKGADQAEALTAATRIQITLFSKQLSRKQQFSNHQFGNQKWGLNGQIFSDWSVTQKALKQAISNAPESEIVIATARDASVEHLLEVMAFLKQQNLQAAQIQMDAVSTP